MRLRSHMMLLAAGAMAPLLAVALVSGLILLKHERESVERDAVGRVRAAMTAVDEALRGAINSLDVLATSIHLKDGNTRAFHEESIRVLAGQPDWLSIGLSSTQKLQLSDAMLPFGEPIALVAAEGAQDLALQSGKPAVSDVVVDRTSGSPTVVISYPVVQDGSVRYLLTVPLRLEPFSNLLRAQQLPSDWVIALVDRTQRFIARLPVRPPGDLASASFREAIAKAPQGFFRGVTTEGLQSFTPYVTSPVSGWVLGVAMPASLVNAGVSQLAVTLLTGLAAATLVAWVLALWMTARLAAPITAMAAASEALQRGDPVALPDTDESIREVAQLQNALRAAARAAVERESLLEREKAALRSADRSKDEFLAMLSHELRNPLGALTTAAHVLQKAPPAEAMSARARGVVARQTAHMAKLINDLLDVSRIQMGKLDLRLARMNLGEVVSAIVDDWRNAGRLAQHQLVLQATAVWVDADRERIEQVLSNLLDNALKFTPAGRSVAVHVGQSGTEAVLTVHDQGSGISAADLARMFGLFNQGEQGLDRAKGGMGIGLALVKRLVEMHGGTVTAASAGAGQGALFTVRLPATSAPQALPADVVPSTTAIAARRILVVDDNDDVRQMMVSALTLAGHDVVEADSGSSALTAALTTPPDIALIDIGLPDIDGYQVANRLRSDAAGKHIVLIAVTGYGLPADEQRAAESGFIAHLSKPLDLEDLESVLASLPPSLNG